MSNRLEGIKNEYAKELELSNWDDMIEYFLAGDVNGIFYAYDNVIRKYTEECCKASLEKASEESRMNHHDGFHKSNKLIRYYQIGADNLQIDKNSITNPYNIVLL